MFRFNYIGIVLCRGISVDGVQLVKRVIDMLTTSSVGNGYYNYYHDKSRYETPDGKAITAWYDRDLTTEEIGKNNAGVLNKEIGRAHV